MKKYMCLLFVLLGNLLFSESLKIHPATYFDTDLKYKGYYDFKGIKISNYYDLDNVICLNINDDEIEDYLILLVPKSIIPPLSDDFNFNENKFYRRIIVEIITYEKRYYVGNTYYNLISNKAGLCSGFNGISKVDSLTEEEAKSITLSVFKQTSINFEKSQKKTDFIKQSSFAEEDLPSNILNYYVELFSFSKEKIFSLTNVLPMELSLWIYNRYTFQKNYTFEPIILIPGGEKPKIFDSVEEIPEGKLWQNI